METSNKEKITKQQSKTLIIITAIISIIILCGMSVVGYIFYKKNSNHTPKMISMMKDYITNIDKYHFTPESTDKCSEHTMKEELYSKLLSGDISVVPNDIKQTISKSFEEESTCRTTFESYATGREHNWVNQLINIDCNKVVDSNKCSFIISGLNIEKTNARLRSGTKAQMLEREKVKTECLIEAYIENKNNISIYVNEVNLCNKTYQSEIKELE